MAPDPSILRKYPFKSMIDIVDALPECPSMATIRDLQNASDACFGDTIEVVDMLAYLTSFGATLETPQGWLRTQEAKERPDTPSRMHFLLPILSVVSVLDPSIPKTVIKISEETKLNIELTGEVLGFLRRITGRGYVKTNDSSSFDYCLSRMHA